MRLHRPVARLSRAYSRLAAVRSFHRHAISLDEKKRLDVAIVGLPNAGKSQLLNMLTQSTVAAVSRKRHTTRDEILGARTVDDTQIVFLDTPGFLRYDHAKKEGLDRDITSTATAEMENVDFTLLVVDAARRMTNDYRESVVELMLGALKSKGRLELSKPHDSDSLGPSTLVQKKHDDLDSVRSSRFAVVLNKVDLVHPKLDLIDIAENLGNLAEECVKYSGKTSQGDVLFDDLGPDELEAILPTFFYTSALKDQGVDDVLNFLVEQATPCDAWEVEAGEATMQTPEERVEEVIREKIYRCLHKEVPYQIRQNNRLFQVGNDKVTGKPSLVVHQDLIVRSKSHQELVFGGGGKTIERIRDTAERDLADMFKCDVSLRLHVKLLKRTQRNWSV